MTEHTSKSSSKDTGKKEKKEAEKAAKPILDDLMTQVKELQAERDELKDKVLRVAAELQNAQRLHTQRLEDANKFGITNLAKDMLTVSENLSRALDVISSDDVAEGSQLKSLYDGIEITQRELLSVFDKHGISRILPSLGDPFNHDLHQAISQLPTAEYPAGTIAQVLQGGYHIHGRLLRPALVIVASNPA